MPDLSNKSLALLLVVAVVVSLVGTFASLDKLAGFQVPVGFATANDTGTVLLVITENVTITFTVDTINWGSGTVNNTMAGDYCTLDTEGTNPLNCTGFTTVSTPFRIHNDGNENVSLQIRANASADDLFGLAATNPEFEWKAEENSSRIGCTTANLNGSITSYTRVNTSDIYMCGTASTYKFQPGANNVVNLHMRVQFPDDTPSGSKAALITATGTSAP